MLTTWGGWGEDATLTHPWLKTIHDEKICLLSIPIVILSCKMMVLFPHTHKKKAEGGQGGISSERTRTFQKNYGVWSVIKRVGLKSWTLPNLTPSSAYWKSKVDLVEYFAMANILNIWNTGTLHAMQVRCNPLYSSSNQNKSISSVQVRKHKNWANTQDHTLCKLERINR